MFLLMSILHAEDNRITTFYRKTVIMQESRPKHFLSHHGHFLTQEDVQHGETASFIVPFFSKCCMSEIVLQIL